MHVAKGEFIVVTRVANGLNKLVSDFGLLGLVFSGRLDDAAAGGLVVFGVRDGDRLLNFCLIVLFSMFDSFLIRLIDIVMDTVMDTDGIVIDTDTHFVMDTDTHFVMDTADIVMDIADIVMDTDTAIAMDTVIVTGINVVVGKECLLHILSSITICLSNFLIFFFVL